MLNNEQDQTVSDGSTAFQAGNDVNVTYQGLSYPEVRLAALDVFKANFYELTEKAREIAQLRAEEITEKFLQKLQNEYPSGFQKANDPDFQDSMFTIQKEYAKCGDKELGDLLVDILCDRSKQNQRDILQIVLSESLKTAPKITANQVSVLSTIFLFRYTQNSSVGNHDLFGLYLDRHIQNEVAKIVKNDSCYQHLEYTGCGTISLAEEFLENFIGTIYQGLFLKGFDKSEFDEKNISIGFDSNIIIPCLNSPVKYQIGARSKEQLDEIMKKNNVPIEDQAKITELFNKDKMSEQEIKNKCIEIRPYMETVFDVWNTSSMKQFVLTSVGISIGHANIKRLIGEFAPLSIWIN